MIKFEGKYFVKFDFSEYLLGTGVENLKIFISNIRKPS